MSTYYEERIMPPPNEADKYFLGVSGSISQKTFVFHGNVHIQYQGGEAAANCTLHRDRPEWSRNMSRAAPEVSGLENM